MNAVSSERLGNAVRQATLDAGYEPIDNLVYKAIWSSSEVEHFVYFVESGKRGGAFLGWFGMRNVEAEFFSVNAIRSYSGEFHFQALKYDRRKSCTMRFQFGILDRSGWCITVPTMSNVEIDRCVGEFISKYLYPILSNIATIDKYLGLIVSDAEPFRWALTNGAIRAAQIVALAAKAGLTRDWVRSVLEPRLQFISNGLARSAPMRADPAGYVEKLMADWETRSSTEPDRCEIS
jgi:hypothetical protein